MTTYVIFTAPLFLDATLRYSSGTAHLPGVDLTILSLDALDKLLRDLLDRIARRWQVREALNPPEVLKLIRVEPA